MVHPRASARLPPGRGGVVTDRPDLAPEAADNSPGQGPGKMVENTRRAPEGRRDLSNITRTTLNLNPGPPSMKLSDRVSLRAIVRCQTRPAPVNLCNQAIG